MGWDEWGGVGVSVVWCGCGAGVGVSVVGGGDGGGTGASVVGYRNTSITEPLLHIDVPVHVKLFPQIG